MLKYVVNTYSYYVNTFDIEIRPCNVDFIILIIIYEIIIKLFIFVCDDLK